MSRVLRLISVVLSGVRWIGKKDKITSLQIFKYINCRVFSVEINTLQHQKIYWNKFHNGII